MAKNSLPLFATLVALILASVGCALFAPVNEEPDAVSKNSARYIAVSDTYTLTLRQLTELKTAGYLDRQQIEAVSVTARQLGDFLDQWYNALERGEVLPTAFAVAQGQLAQLQFSLLEAQLARDRASSEFTPRPGGVVE